MSNARRRLRGHTLLEALAAVVITAMIMGAVLAVSMASMRIWRLVSSRSQAYPPAYAVITRITREVKNAYAIRIEDDGARLIFHVPLTDDNGINALDASGRFQLGHEYRYYLADETGAEDSEGAILWRKDTDYTADPRSPAVTLRRLADNVQEVQFNQLASQNGRVFALYSTTITTLGKEGRVTHTSTFNSTTAFRNPN